MRSFSEIETAVKRATRGIGFSWGVAEEVGKNIRLLEMFGLPGFCLLYTSPSPRDVEESRMPSSA